ncbi:hypothetical protein [Coraliomargarita parva]|uniref:hypothetical protein n=1 Tax=Coraliomargarita parva TaxID=3014050 RepID=UPI0022B4EA0C|nr:hypothetical protein [Coraliomargarita parva]
MGAPTTTERALLLRSTLTGESYLKLDILSAEQGACVCLKRVSRKNTQAVTPDLFDTAEIELEQARQGTTRFVRDYRPLLRRDAIGKVYKRLQHAAHFSQIIILNAPHMPDADTLFALAERSFDAFNSGKTPEIVALKGIYLLLRDEGFPVNESWWPQVPNGLRSTAKDILNQPAPSDAPADIVDVGKELMEHLHHWMRRETDLMLPKG